MLEWLTAPETIVFSAALTLMLAIGVIEAIGLGVSGLDLHLDVHFDHDGLLGWLGVGRVPLLVTLIAFLTAFGIIGLAGQQIAEALLGRMLPSLAAVPGAAVLALPVTAVLGRGLARIMPHDQTSAVDLDELIGRAGTITVGRARDGSPARTRVLDPHGQAHHVLVEPNDPAAVFEEGDTVRLVRREGERFRAILHDSPRLSNWID
ncbi:YqiJ family protein [Sphingomonas sp. KR1UV-12]|uniref:YqiJ family protein n=1 Tax=Sphingomonas aurea TaxID=3063994 RepID=A0ABT9ENW9_9SPHN|nr:YqiJ family protein [Sphingomonas sp. KR1UV-12]MDP1028665.1 YqiJ family protein [Sphingomonas sp. KR1UV-12]